MLLNRLCSPFLRQALSGASICAKPRAKHGYTFHKHNEDFSCCTLRHRFQSQIASIVWKASSKRRRLITCHKESIYSVYRIAVLQVQSDAWFCAAATIRFDYVQMHLSAVLEKMMISSKYTEGNCHLTGVEMRAVVSWQVPHALQSTNCMRVNLYIPWCEGNAVSWRSASPIYSYQ